MPSELIDEAMKRVFAKIQGEMPDVKNPEMAPNQNMPMNRMAQTDPITGKIEYNPFMLQVMGPNEREQAMTHEMTHVKQVQDTPYYRRLMDAFLPNNTPYLQKDQEMAAFQAERDRSLKNHFSIPDPVSGATDINLPSQKRKYGTP